MNRLHPMPRSTPTASRRRTAWIGMLASASSRSPAGSSANDQSLGGPLGGEQRGLRLPVRLHRLVEVEVLVAQVGEDGHVEGDPLHPVLGQRVARHLHRHRVGALVREPAVPLGRQQRLQLRGLGGGPGPGRASRSQGGRSPARLSTAPRRCDTVVFPLVPVTPAVSSWRDGWPKKADARRPHGRAPGRAATRSPPPRSPSASSTARSHTHPDRAAGHRIGGESWPSEAPGQTAEERARDGPVGCRARPSRPPRRGRPRRGVRRSRRATAHVHGTRTIGGRGPAHVRSGRGVTGRPMVPGTAAQVMSCGLGADGRRAGA